MKLSGVTRLVPGNFWVGSTPAQSLRGGGRAGQHQSLLRLWGAFFQFAFFTIKNALLLNYVHPTF